MGKVGIAGLMFSGVSLGLIVLSSALPYWVRLEQTGGVTTVGLWMSCSKGDKDEEALCRELASVPEYILAVRALVLMGLFLMVSAISLIRVKKEISLIGGAISIAAGICMLTGAIVYFVRSGYLASGDAVHYHASFALAIIAGVVGIVGGILSIRGKSD